MVRRVAKAKRVLVIGLGEVGSAIYSLVADAGYRVYGYDVDPSKSFNRLEDVKTPVDVMHVCFPYSKAFIDAVVGYVEMFKPSLVLIESTVPPGTTEEVYRRAGVNVVHSPVRGRHPKLKEHLKMWVKWVGSVTPEAGRVAKEYYESLGLRVRIASNPRVTELAKLVETTYRAFLIAWWQEVHRMSRFFGVRVTEVAEFVAEVHKVLGDRPVYYPGFIGGHCLIPNVKIMKECYPHMLWNFVLESNDKRAGELKSPGVAREVEAVKKIWSGLVPRWYFE